MPPSAAFVHRAHAGQAAVEMRLGREMHHLGGVRQSRPCGAADTCRRRCQRQAVGRQQPARVCASGEPPQGGRIPAAGPSSSSGGGSPSSSTVEGQGSFRLFSSLNPDTLKHEPGTVLGAAALVAGTTVGAGILALPAVSSASGFGASAVALTGCCLYSIGAHDCVCQHACMQTAAGNA